MQLTKRQKEILEFIKAFVADQGYSPSLEEIGRHFGIASLNAVYKHLAALEERGFIRRSSNRARSIQIVSGSEGGVELPLLGYVAAGRPIEAIPHAEPLKVPEALVSRSGPHFVLKVRGDSMIDEHIADGDHVIVAQRTTAQNGETVVALVQGEVTLKKFYREPDGRVRLQPANATLPSIILDGGDVQIQGVVVAVMRKY
ncbi:MAG: transcriptional repressor LexA [Acidobacteria bacterium]|nr:transcriptional repressor LexA [Acidobacteriota bacterium]